MPKSLELFVDVRHAWDEVDGSASHNKSWLAGEAFGHGRVDLLRGDAINSVAVLMEGQVSEGLEVASNLLKSFVLSFHGHKYVHLEDVLGASKFNISDWLTESIKFFQKNSHELSRVRAWAFDSHAKETRVSEVRVDG